MQKQQKCNQHIVDIVCNYCKVFQINKRFSK